MVVNDGKDIRLSQLRGPVFFAEGTAVTRRLFSVVANIGAEMEVVGVNAVRIVARMKHLQAIGDWAAIQFPSDAMCPLTLLAACAKSYLSIPIGIYTSGP